MKRTRKHTRADPATPGQQRAARRTPGASSSYRRYAGVASPPVQGAGNLSAPDAGSTHPTAHDTAHEGVDAAGGTLPHAGAIQSSFGRHDVGGVRAHVGGAAATACDALGARAYATGNDVAFAQSPDLFTAAHEAAHTVQQRGGVQLTDNIGRVSDSYEQHADQVADKVVHGESAEALLDPRAGGGESSAVQRAAVQFDAESDAKGLEARDKGHSLDRHGPQVTDKQLTDRLTTGIAPDGAVSPAPGLSTKFASHELYMETRNAAVAKCKSGLAQTFTRFKPLLTALKKAQKDFDTAPPGPEKAPMGAVGKPLADAKKALQDSGDSLPSSNANMFSVKVSAGAAKLENKVLLYQSYEVVVDHGKPIGSGHRGQDPKQIADPRDGDKSIDVFGSTTPVVGGISKTRTTFDLGAKAPLLQGHNPGAWNAAQHFPADEDVGIHGP